MAITVQLSTLSLHSKFSFIKIQTVNNHLKIEWSTEISEFIEYYVFYRLSNIMCSTFPIRLCVIMCYYVLYVMCYYVFYRSY